MLNKLLNDFISSQKNKIVENIDLCQIGER